jgi:TrpR-related protein YerC/YecD
MIETNEKQKRLYFLYRAFSTIEKYEDFNCFIQDLLTPNEIHIICERLEVARLLNEKFGSYKAISEHSGASLVTVTRVARFLKYENNSGYKNILTKIQ